MANDPITYHKLRQKARDFLLTTYQGWMTEQETKQVKLSAFDLVPNGANSYRVCFHPL